jgi:hypothetical protein
MLTFYSVKLAQRIQIDRYKVFNQLPKTTNGYIEKEVRVAPGT